MSFNQAEADNGRSLERVLAEKTEVEKALASVTDLYKNAAAEKEQLTKLFAEFKSHHGTLKAEKDSYQQRLVEEITARKRSEGDCEDRLRAMHARIDAKDRELDALTQKMQLPVDQDILRMRIQKDLETKYRGELNTKTAELEAA